MSGYASRANPKPSEPVLSVGTVTAVVAAALGLLVALGLDISDDVQTQLLGLIAVAAPVVAAFVARRKVKPVADIVRESAVAFRDDGGL
jgi:hypothetical protein